jgi:hypothetical protein
LKGAVTQYDDAIRNYREAEKIVKKLASTDPQAKTEEQTVKKAIDDMIAAQKKGDNGGKVAQQKAAPNQNLRIAAYVTICAAAAGLLAYVVMKNRK